MLLAPNLSRKYNGRDPLQSRTKKTGAGLADGTLTLSDTIGLNRYGSTKGEGTHLARLVKRGNQRRLAEECWRELDLATYDYQHKDMGRRAPGENWIGRSAQIVIWQTLRCARLGEMR